MIRAIALVVLIALSVGFGFTGPVLADKHEVFGQSLMTASEISDYKNRLTACKTDREREQVKAEHKDRMVQRARWKGLVIRPETVTMAGYD